MFIPENNAEIIYRLGPQVAFEAFEDGGLVLKLVGRTLTELNPTSRDVLILTDGSRSQAQVAEALAAQYDISDEEAQVDVAELYRQLLEQKILEAVLSPPGKDGPAMTEIATTQYICNPDVVLREEDEDGGLLFNPDTNQVKVINTTGLFIWQQCGVARTLDKIVAEVQKGFDEVPSEQVAEDVKEFVDGMLATGFIGTVEQ